MLHNLSVTTRMELIFAEYLGRIWCLVAKTPSRRHDEDAGGLRMERVMPEREKNLHNGRMQPLILQSTCMAVEGFSIARTEYKSAFGRSYSNISRWKNIIGFLRVAR